MTAIFLGTSFFAAPIAAALQKNFGDNFLGAITKPDKPVGRKQSPNPSPIALWAKNNRARLWQPATKKELAALIKELRPDVAVVAAYGKIIPPEALTVPRFGFVNIHPSLLPKYRGPSPIQTAIANGDKEIGITLMLLDEEIDHGPIIAQERVALSLVATRLMIENELAERSATLLARALPEYLAGRIVPQPQDHAAATITPLLSRDDGRLDWHEAAAALEKKIRAYDGWPGAWLSLPNNKRLKVLEASVGKTIQAAPGAIAGNDFSVACGDGRLLILKRVQPEGGQKMNGAAFLRGYRGSRALI